MKKTTLILGGLVIVLALYIFYCNVEITIEPANNAVAYITDVSGNLWIGNQIVVQDMIPTVNMTICLSGHGDVFLAGGIDGNKGMNGAQFYDADWYIVSINGMELVFVNGGRIGP